MPGQHITDAQKAHYWQLRSNMNVTLASHKAGFSKSSGYLLEKAGSDPQPEPPPRERRVPDALFGYWETVGVPLLEANPGLRAVSVLKEMQRLYPEITDKKLRTVQRRAREWRDDRKSRRSACFPREHPPGREAQVDFTRMAGITVAGRAHCHILFQYRLVASGWVHLEVVEGGESFRALATGIDNAIWQSGGVPEAVCTDNLSAAYRNRQRGAGDETFLFADLCSHYGMAPRRTNPASPNENGAVESSNRHRCDEIEDALALRGSRDFASAEEYRQFIGLVAEAHNLRRSARFEAEQPRLGDLPSRRYMDFEDRRVTVDPFGGFRLKGVRYILPAEARRGKLTARIRFDRIEVFRGGKRLLALPRGRSEADGGSGWVVDFRHVLDDLAVKPRALLDLAYLNDLFPDPAFLETFQRARQCMPDLEACRLAIALLELARARDCDRKLARLLRESLDRGELPNLDALTAQTGRLDMPLSKCLGGDRNDTPRFQLEAVCQSADIHLAIAKSDAPPTCRLALNDNDPHQSRNRNVPPFRFPQTTANDN